MVIMEDVRMNYVCARMKSVNVPFLGTVTMTAVLPEDADITADKLTIDSALLSGPMALDEMIIGAGAAEPTPRSGSAAVGLSSGSLTAGHLDVELAGLHATRLTSSTIELRSHRLRGVDLGSAHDPHPDRPAGFRLLPRRTPGREPRRVHRRDGVGSARLRGGVGLGPGRSTVEHVVAVCTSGEHDLGRCADLTSTSFSVTLS